MVPIIKMMISANLNGLIINKVKNISTKNNIEGKNRKEEIPKNIPLLKIIFLGSWVFDSFDNNESVDIKIVADNNVELKVLKEENNEVIKI